MDKNSDNLLKLGANAKRILENYKGILAVDESPNSIGEKFKKFNIENTEENRKNFRELLFTSDHLEKYIGGVILNEETFSQKTNKDESLVDILLNKNIDVGIKLDKGLQDFEDNEKISVGLEDLENRIQNPLFEKATFAKWRSLFLASKDLPTISCIDENCQTLAKYASICQKYGKVPIVEPELYFNGNYHIDDAKRHTKSILSHLLRYLNDADVYIPGILIKMGYVTQGTDSEVKNSYNEIGMATLEGMISTIPCGVPGIVFLSGGHTEEDAIGYLRSVNSLRAFKTWDISFSYGRTLTDRPMEIWNGKETNKMKAQSTFIEIAEKCYLANQGK
ncbi:fructose-bisphosphate aldolase A (ALDOA) [Vairimorpha necatrix]|uniref:fructose-bisphosphate aldolase n=1 Tax=Vairimorpha necatrix TaxID=6039 RepID=A0AAX4JDT1_9MICR